MHNNVYSKLLCVALDPPLSSSLHARQALRPQRLQRVVQPEGLVVGSKIMNAGVVPLMYKLEATAQSCPCCGAAVACCLSAVPSFRWCCAGEGEAVAAFFGACGVLGGKRWRREYTCG